MKTFNLHNNLLNNDNRYVAEFQTIILCGNCFAIGILKL